MKAILKIIGLSLMALILFSECSQEEERNTKIQDTPWMYSLNHNLIYFDLYIGEHRYFNITPIYNLNLKDCNNISFMIKSGHFPELAKFNYKYNTSRIYERYNNGSLEKKNKITTYNSTKYYYEEEYREFYYNNCKGSLK